jgi:hypothetical protein
LKGPLLFLRVHPLGAAALTLAGLGCLVYVFGTVPLPGTRSADHYRAAVFFVSSPVVTSVAALGSLSSRASQWEVLSRRPLGGWRCLLALLALAASAVVLVPAAIVSAESQPGLLIAQGCLLCTGLGMCVGVLASYEVQAAVVVTYGLVSLMFRGADVGPLRPLLAIGVTPSWADVLAALLLALVGVIAYSRGWGGFSR